MKQLLAVIALLASTTGLYAGDAAAGKNKSMLCSTCHGAEGVSIADNWPNLAGQHETYLKKQLTEFRGGKRVDPQMSAMAMALSDTDIADLAAYYASMAVPTTSVKENFVAIGSKIYTGGDADNGVMACIACHGPNGHGIDAAGFPSLQGQKVPYTIKQLKDFRAGNRNNDLNGMMHDVAKGMTDEQIEAVANYVAALQ